MSKPVIRRKTDKSTADPCGAPPRVPAEGSPNVFANFREKVRVKDNYESHPCPGAAPHIGYASVGSLTVFVNKKAVHRRGDDISCGSKGDNGSPNVLEG